MENVIEEFYTAFNSLDAERMTKCYHPDIEFEDPAFGKLKGERAKNMWRMLCDSQKGKDFQVSFSNVSCQNDKGSAKWVACYTFTPTKRKVTNHVSASFEFKDDLIIKHTDTFDFYGWTKQALGFVGYLIGWTSFVQKRFRATTHGLLDKYERKQNK